MADEPKISVLLIEDDPRLGELVHRYLEGTGFTVHRLTSGVRALETLREHLCDIVVLDLMLPGRDGIDVCRDLRAHVDTPIIMVTARREESDRILGLDVGADDYVMKPFSSRELVSRIRAVVRRAQGRVGPEKKKVLRAGDVTLDPSSMTVFIKDKEIALTSYEFALLKIFAERAGRVLSREQLLDHARVGGADEAFERSIDVQIHKLRQKLGDDARTPRYLKTIRGAGYMLATSSED